MFCNKLITLKRKFLLKKGVFLRNCYKNCFARSIITKIHTLLLAMAEKGKHSCYNKCNNYVITFYREIKMIRKIVQVGNSWGVIIPLFVLKLLKVNPVLDKLEFEIENDVLKIRKYQSKE